MARTCRVKTGKKKGRYTKCRKKSRGRSRKRSKSRRKRRKSRSKSRSRWHRHLMKVYRKDRKAGLTAAMKKAKKSYRKQDHNDPLDQYY